LPATDLTAGAVRSYRTFSPLPRRAGSPAQSVTSRSTGTPRRYIFCATILQVTLTGRYPAHCPAEFGLSSPRLGSSSLWGQARGLASPRGTAQRGLP